MVKDNYNFFKKQNENKIDLKPYSAAAQLKASFWCYACTDYFVLKGTSKK